VIHIELNNSIAAKFPLSPKSFFFFILKNSLGGDLKSTWETLLQSNPTADKLNINFKDHICEFAGNYLPPNAWYLRKQYLDHITKPYQMAQRRHMGKEVGQGTEKTFLVGYIGTKRQDNFSNDVGAVDGGTMFNFDGRVLVVGIAGIMLIAGCLIGLVWSLYNMLKDEEKKTLERKRKVCCDTVIELNMDHAE
jgi:hypothetical protein